MVAVVLCGGNNSSSRRAVNYNGIKDCKAAALVAGGDKACSFGCLGFATCARVCPFNAIEMKDGLAVVHPELCVGCGKCVAACPRNIIKMVPSSAEVHVYCSSPEKGAAKKKVCDVPCIGCRKCVKVAEEGQMVINGFLVSVNYENSPPKDIVEAAGCPTKCLRG
jgi:ferredoxin